MAGDYQGEFFNEFKEGSPRLKDLAKKILPKRKRQTLQVSLESLILLIIVIIVALIVSFAIGVETGTKKYRSQFEHRQREGKRGLTLPKETTPVETPTPVLVHDEIQEEDSIPKEETPKHLKGSEERQIQKIYTIQLSAYKSKRKALAKVEELKKTGVTAKIIHRKRWYEVCAGSYLNRKNAERDLAIFAKTYKGCFLRRN